MKLVLNRISAFFIDILLVTFLAMAVGNLNYLNPYKYNYEEATENYQKVYGELLSTIEDGDIEEMLDKISTPYMNIEKYGIFHDIYYLIFSFLYFVVFSYFNKGQTLGKKIYKIRVVNKNGEKATFTQLLVRNLICCWNFYLELNIFLLIKIILVFSLNEAISFYYTMMIMDYAQSVFEIVSVICLFKNKDRSLSDFISGTKVIDLKQVM